MRLGISPRIVIKQDAKDLSCFPNMKGRTTSCPKYMKLIESQQITKHVVTFAYSLLNKDFNSATSLSSNTYRYSFYNCCFYSQLTRYIVLFYSPNLSRTPHAASILLLATRYLGVSFKYHIPPMRTNTFGKQLNTIIHLQLPLVKLYRKKYAKITAYSLPNETQKLINKIPLPRYFIGDIYANIVVVKEIEKPNENPYMNLANIIC